MLLEIIFYLLLMTELLHNLRIEKRTLFIMSDMVEPSFSFMATATSIFTMIYYVANKIINKDHHSSFMTSVDYCRDGAKKSQKPNTNLVSKFQPQPILQLLSSWDVSSWVGSQVFDFVILKLEMSFECSAGTKKKQPN